MPDAASAPSLPEILFSGPLVLALSAYAALSGIEALLVARVHNALEPGIGGWLWEHFYAPLLRAGVLVAFLLLAAPDIYGVTGPHSATGLLFAVEGRFGHLLGLVFLLSLALPLLPVVGALPALVLPIQGVAGTALVFGWLAQSAGLSEVSYWPGLGTLFLLCGLSVVAYWLATRAVALIQGIGTHWNFADLDELVFEAVLLLFQAPVIIVYSSSLGRQLIL